MPGIAEQLRARTRAEHDRIELALDWEARASDHAAYADWLARLRTFYAVWEPALAAAIDEPVLTEPRRKLPLLDQDLAALGIDAAPAPSAPAYPFITRAEALGAFYVLEGATLGGQVIAAHVRRHLGHAAAFHGSYGKATAAMWREAGVALERLVDPADLAVTTAAANRTFATLRDHLTTQR